MDEAMKQMTEYIEMLKNEKIQEIEVMRELTQINENKKALLQLSEVKLLKQRENDKFNKQEQIRLDKHNRKLMMLSHKEQVCKQNMFKGVGDDCDDCSVATTATTHSRKQNITRDLNATFRKTVRIEAFCGNISASISKTNEGDWKKGQWVDKQGISYKSPNQFWNVFAKNNGLSGNINIWTIKNRMKAHDEDYTIWDIAVNKDRIVIQ